MKKILLSLVVFVFCLSSLTYGQAKYIQFVYSSDSHYGISRKKFQGKENVPSVIVNEAMIQKMNLLPKLKLPNDGGLRNGEVIGGIDYVINTGDITNRMEEGIQSAAASWKQFEKEWMHDLTLKDGKGKKAALYIIPGNHDLSDAVGFTKPMSPLTDASSVINTYNLMLKPAESLTVANYNYARDKVYYSFDKSGIHFAFVQLWPDSQGRAWLEKDLAKAKSEPCLLFTHDQPDVEAKHLINPNGNHDLNTTDKFENLLSDTSSVLSIHEQPVKEMRELASFVKVHPQIKAYFHGNSNFNEYYVWKGPDNDIALNVIRVDSPMKGNISSKDETKLSFQFVVIDPEKRKMTVRECLWDQASADPIVWGESKTIDL